MLVNEYEPGQGIMVNTFIIIKFYYVLYFTILILEKECCGDIISSCVG